LQEDGKKRVDPGNVEEAKKEGARYRIVGFEVEPYTVKHTKVDAAKGWAGNLATCGEGATVTRNDEPQVIDTPGVEVVYTYDVTWEETDVPWSNR
jgi:hypothetical protein